MKEKPIYFVYLNPVVEDKRWFFLKEFFNPGFMERDKSPVLVCFSLDTSFHALLALKARNFSDNKNKTIHIPYSIVDGIQEIPFLKSQAGFLGLKD